MLSGQEYVDEYASKVKKGEVDVNTIDVRRETPPAARMQRSPHQQHAERPDHPVTEMDLAEERGAAPADRRARPSTSRHTGHRVACSSHSTTCVSRCATSGRVVNESMRKSRRCPWSRATTWAM